MNPETARAIAKSGKYINIYERRRNYQRHIDVLDRLQPYIETSEIPMAPRLVAYNKKATVFRREQKKLDDDCIASIMKRYQERQLMLTKKKKKNSTRDWIADLNNVQTPKTPSVSQSIAPSTQQRQTQSARSNRGYRTSAAAKILFPDDQITAAEIYEPVGLEDGMHVTDVGPQSSRSQRNNILGHHKIVQPSSRPSKSVRGNRNTSKLNQSIQEPQLDSSSPSKRKVIPANTQTEHYEGENDYDYDWQPSDTPQNNTLSNTFKSVNSAFENNEQKAESNSQKDENSEHDFTNSDNNEKADESEARNSLNNTTKSEFDTTFKSDFDNTMKSDFESTNKSTLSNQDEDEKEDKDDQDEDDDNKEEDDENHDEDENKDDDDDNKNEDGNKNDDDENKDDDDKDNDDDDKNQSNEGDPFEGDDFTTD